MYNKYKELAHYFSDFLHKDNGKDDHMSAFKDKIISIIERGINDKKDS